MGSHSSSWGQSRVIGSRKPSLCGEGSWVAGHLYISPTYRMCRTNAGVVGYLYVSDTDLICITNAFGMLAAGSKWLENAL